MRALVSLGLMPNIANLSEEEYGTVKLNSINSEDMAFHPKSCNRDLIKQLSNKAFISSTPGWFTFYEKVDTSSIFLSDSTAVSPFVLLLLASNLSFEAHPDPSADSSIDNITKTRLGIRFADDKGRLV